MDIVVGQILNWLAKVLPPLLAAFGLGYKMGKENEAEAKKELLKKELELDLAKNKNKVLEDSYNKLDLDILGDAISEGAAIDATKRDNKPRGT